MSFYFGKSVESTKTSQLMKELSRLMFFSFISISVQFNHIRSDCFCHDWFQLSRKNQLEKNHVLKAPHKVANQMLLLKIKCYCYRSQINIFFRLFSSKASWRSFLNSDPIILTSKQSTADYEKSLEKEWFAKILDFDEKV